MSGTARITVSVPEELLQAIDAKLAGDQGRSALVRRLLEAALREAEEREEVERYIRGYTEQPQTEDELGWADQTAAAALHAVPWD